MIDHETVLIPLESISERTSNIRRMVSEDHITNLAANISTYGLLHPIIVTEVNDGAPRAAIQEVPTNDVPRPETPGQIPESPPVSKEQPIEEPSPYLIIQGDFFDFARTYSGPKFNCLHLDFPYGEMNLSHTLLNLETIT